MFSSVPTVPGNSKWKLRRDSLSTSWRACGKISAMKKHLIIRKFQHNTTQTTTTTINHNHNNNKSTREHENIRRAVHLLDGHTGHPLTHLKQFVRAKVLLYTNNASTTSDNTEGIYEDVENEILPVCVAFCEKRHLGPWVALENLEGWQSQDYHCQDERELVPYRLGRKSGLRAVVFVPMSWYL